MKLKEQAKGRVRGSAGVSYGLPATLFDAAWIACNAWDLITETTVKNAFNNAELKNNLSTEMENAISFLMNWQWNLQNWILKLWHKSSQISSGMNIQRKKSTNKHKNMFSSCRHHKTKKRSKQRKERRVKQKEKKGI